jgi:hypothetical protein
MRNKFKAQTNKLLNKLGSRDLAMMWMRNTEIREFLILLSRTMYPSGFVLKVSNPLTQYFRLINGS